MTYSVNFLLLGDKKVKKRLFSPVLGLLLILNPLDKRCKQAGLVFTIQRSIFIIANPSGTITLIEKPNRVKVNTTSNAIMLEQDGFVLTSARGQIRLSCNNGAPDVTIEVELL